MVSVGIKVGITEKNKIYFLLSNYLLANIADLYPPLPPSIYCYKRNRMKYYLAVP